MLIAEQVATLQPGDKLKLYYNPGNPNNTTLHVRGRVDGRVITRRWNRHKERWNYEVHGPEFFIVFGPNLTLRRATAEKER